jgi:hypothetical protein
MRPSERCVPRSDASFGALRERGVCLSERTRSVGWMLFFRSFLSEEYRHKDPRTVEWVSYMCSKHWGIQKKRKEREIGEINEWEVVCVKRA